MKLLVMAPSHAELIDGPRLIAAAQQHFGDQVRVVPSRPGWETDFYLEVTFDDDTMTVSHFIKNTSVTFDSNDLAVREGVAWYRSLLPVDFPRVIACDPGWNGHVDLYPGITAQGIVDGWVDHAIEGWNEGDPDFG